MGKRHPHYILQYHTFALMRKMSSSFTLTFLNIISLCCISQATNFNSSEISTDPNEIIPDLIEERDFDIDKMFWLPRVENSSITGVNTTETEDEPMADEKQGIEYDPIYLQQDMEEEIFLNRSNCNIELQIKESEERRLRIRYENLKRNMFGLCQTTLHGKNGIFLAVLVSNIQFSGQSRSGEKLSVQTRNNYFNFTLIEYRGNENYYPVILTESDRAFLVLHFNGTNSSSKRTSFDLEVFNYYKNKNQNNFQKEFQDSSHGYGHSGKDVDNIFITTLLP